MWPFLYLPGDRLSVAELMAARLDGDVVEVGDAFIPADAVETAQLRAASLRSLVPPTLALTLESAAWVHGALAEPPARHRVQRVSARRIPTVVAARLVYRDVRLPPEDAQSIGGVVLSTPVRTVVDLARDLAGGRADAGAGLDAMLRWRPPLASAAVTWLAAAAPLHFKRPALALLRARCAAAVTAGQEEVTRYTS